jgi:RNA-directed DNA polymerase
VLEPIIEADFEDNTYGFRPAPEAVVAVREVHRHISARPRFQIVLRLIKLWLRAPTEDRDGDDRKRRMTGGQDNTRGTPQSWETSPLLSNIYMNRFVDGTARHVAANQGTF